MTLVEAAVELLREFSKPMTSDELASLAVEREMLTRAGADPAKSMETRLATEAKKAAKAVVVASGKDKWTLGPAAAVAGKTKAKASTKAKPKAAKPKAAKPTAAKPTAAKPTAAKPTAAKPTAKPTAKAKPTTKTAKSNVAETSTQASAASAIDDTGSATGAAAKPRPSRSRRGAKAKPTVEAATAGPVVEEPSRGAIDTKAAAPEKLEGGAPPIALDSAPPAVELDVVLGQDKSPARLTLEGPESEEAAAALYADEVVEGEVLRANTEYRDALTADEDRPMLPEISNRRDFRERGGRGRDGTRRRRRDPRDRGDRGGRDRGQGERDRGPRPERDGQAGGESRATAPAERTAERPAAARAVPAVVAAAAVSEAIGVSAEVVYSQSNTFAVGARRALDQVGHTQAVQIKQLAQMMKKRQLFNGDPERDWATLKAALLADTNTRQRAGLDPLMSYRGRDLFAPAGSTDIGTPETNLAAALIIQRSASRQALQARLAAASPAGFERACHAYLVQRGYEDIRWVKRVDATSYGLATAPDGLGQTLVAARSGADSIDRRGIGELRAGVEAKDLGAGLLMAPSTLSEEARVELGKPGKSISVLCGSALIDGFANCGVGIASQIAVIERLDETFLNEVVERT